MHVRSHIANHDQHGIDLAPMLDFVINLLIFFIITAVFVTQSGIVLNRTSASPVNTPGPEANLIRIDASGDIFVDGRIVDRQAVRANVERMKSVDPERGVLIVADSGAPTGVLVGVADQVRLAGIDDVAFSTE